MPGKLPGGLVVASFAYQYELINLRKIGGINLKFVVSKENTTKL
jgi:hypothetical protein